MSDKMTPSRLAEIEQVDELCRYCAVTMLASDKCLTGIMSGIATRAKPDYTVTGVAGEELSAGLLLRWETRSAGFGELTIWCADGKIDMDTEAMSAAFVKSVLCRMVDDWFEGKG